MQLQLPGLVAAICLTATSPLAQEVDPHVRACLQVLRDQRAAGHGVDEQLRSRLIELATVDAGPVVELLLDGQLPPIEEGDEVQLFNRYQEDLALDAVAAAGTGIASAPLPTSRSLRRTEGRELRIGLRLLGITLPGERAEEIVDATERLDEETGEPLPLGRERREALRHGLADLVERDLPGALGPLERELADGPEDVRLAIVTALGDVADPRALGSLVEALTERRLRADLLLGQIAKVGPTLDGKANDAAARELVNLLGDPTTSVRESAIHALGVLRSSVAVEPLVELLRTPGPLADQAHRSLQRITGSRLPANATLWDALVRSERELGSRAEELVAELRRQPVSKQAGLFRELAGATIARDAVAEAIVELLDADERALREATARLLARLDSPRALDGLLAALWRDPESESVRAALTELFQEDLGPEPLTWEQSARERLPLR